MTAPSLFDHVPAPATHEEIVRPENGPYFLDTKKGYMVMKDFHWGDVLLNVHDSPLLPELAPALWTRPKTKIPNQLIGQALSFFKAIYEKQHTEAMADITWSEEHGYRLFIPPQDVSRGGVNATRNPEHYRGQIVGTIHSHCDFNAYHSGIDEHDAEKNDGLHITIGDVMKPYPTIALMISAGGNRWDTALAAVVDGPLEIHPHPAWWERYVEDPAVTRAKKAETQNQTQLWKSNTQTATTTVVDARKPSSIVPVTDLGRFIVLNEENLDDDDTWHLELLASQIETIRNQLAYLGIDMDTEFVGEIEPREITFEKTDEDDDPWNDPNTDRTYHMPF